jgi:hypothetical protein
MKEEKLYLTHKKEGSICELEKNEVWQNFYVPVKPTLNPERFIPKKGQMYCYINSFGQIETITKTDDSYDSYRILTGNCFRDELHAKTKHKVHIAMLELAKEYPVNWKRNGLGGYPTEKYMLVYDTVLKKPRFVFDNTAMIVGTIYFSCRDIEKLYEKGVTKEELGWYCKRER